MPVSPDCLKSAESSVEKILTAAEIEFGNHGLDSIDVQTIARRAGVSSQLIYHYFTKKEHLYEEVLVRMTNRFFERYPSITCNRLDPLETIYEFAFSYCEFYVTYPLTGRLLLDQVLHHGHQIARDPKAESLRSKLFSELREALTIGHARGLTKPDISAEGLFFLTFVLTVGYTTISGLLDGINLAVPELSDGSDVRARVAESVLGAVRIYR